jgi:hypothetical protein
MGRMVGNGVSGGLKETCRMGEVAIMVWMVESAYDAESINVSCR